MTRYVARGADVIAQERHAMAVGLRHHDLLIAAGFEWDGMDGYLAPPGFTEEQGAALWQEALDG